MTEVNQEADEYGSAIGWTVGNKKHKNPLSIFCDKYKTEKDGIRVYFSALEVRRLCEFLSSIFKK